MKKILIITVSLIFIALIGAFAYLHHIKTKAIPDYSENIKLKGLSDDVEVIRDKYGIPHIYAKNEKDLYTAVGYVMAQDRLWQMDLLRRVTTGRLSEMFGSKTIEADKLMRALEMPTKSAMVWDSLSVEEKISLEAFAEGVNQFIESNLDKLPPEFTLLGYQPEKWEPLHSINLIGYMAWDLTSGWSNEFILRKIKAKVGDKAKVFIPDMENQKDLIFSDFKADTTHQKIVQFLNQSEILEELGASIFFGSNNWAVSGKKSVTSGPILANDMHLGLFAPGIWYQMHLNIEGKLNVTGLALPGQPNIVAGHNENIAWGMTNVMLDETDFYKETINPQNENQYKLDSKWLDFRIKEEEIKVKDAESIKYKVKFTHRGAVVSEFKNIPDEVISMNWIGTRYSNELRSIYRLNRAKNWTDFREAVKTFIAVSQNVVYADDQGNIGLQTCAGLAIRQGNRIDIYPGDTSQYDWKGIVPFEELPYSYNPECGYVASANNRTVGEDYPHYISTWFIPPYRYNRIVEMLNAKEKLSVDDFKQMLGDQKSHLVLKFQKDIVASLEKNTQFSGNEKIALDSLKVWNAIMDKNSISATVFEEWMIQFMKLTTIDELGEEIVKDFMSSKVMARGFVENIWKTDSEWYDNIETSDKKETFDDMVLQSFKKTIAFLETTYGKETKKWMWGDVHQITFKHPMGSEAIVEKLFSVNRGPFRVGGSSHTVSPYSYSLNSSFNEVNHGSSHRHIFLPQDWDASQTIIPTGTSGIPASDFYCNLTQMYIDNVYHDDFISRKKIEKNGTTKMKFEK